MHLSDSIIYGTTLEYTLIWRILQLILLIFWILIMKIVSDIHFLAILVIFALLTKAKNVGGI